MTIAGWLKAQGFEVFHIPGISRAWRYEFPDRSSLLITNLGGYDLPVLGGPYSVTRLSFRDELIEFEPLLKDPQDLYHYFHRCQRGQARSLR